MSVSGKSPSGSSLAGRVVLISGGAQGIGLAIAQRFQCEGSRVALIDCDSKAGEVAAAQLTGRFPALPATFLHADVQRPAEVHSAIDAIRSGLGRVDILVNNAAIEIERPFSEIALEEWDSVLSVNLRGAFLLTQTALPLFPPEGGAIVNISSIHATRAFPNALPYACAKAGLIAMTRNLALELAPRHIRVNSVSPGYIDTRLWENYLNSVDNPEQLAAQTTALHPLGRRGLPADVAEAALYMCGYGSEFITGADLVVDGGLTIRAHT
jgi:NAD(P)-dependent dehydrogenase (short-subunit alcohol dehydrogenase family)